MSQPDILYQWFKEIESQMDCLSRPQAVMLASFSLGMAQAKQCTLNRIAQSLATLGKPDTVERRLQRFLSNPRLEFPKCAAAWANWVLASLASPETVLLLVDETSLKNRLKVMAVSLAYHAKAIPLAWECYPPKQRPLGQVELISTLLGQLSKAIPPGAKVLVEADRGIGTSPELLKAIENLGYYFLVRVQGQVRLVLAEGREVAFNELVTAVGDKFKGPVSAFKKAGWLRCWAVGQWESGQDEPWLLLTNWPQAQGNWYGLRMWQELAFRDFKSSGWQWQRSHVWKPKRAAILWLVMALAYVWVLSLGTQVVINPEWLRELSRGKVRRKSLFQLGLSYLQRWIDLGRQLYYHLCLIPHIPGLSKSVVY
jgi:hypothetical protein